MSVNYSALSFLTSDEVIAVKGVFQNEDGLDRYSSKQKEYTYKTTDKSLKKGDLCVVQCAGESANFGFAVIKLTAVDVEIDFNTQIAYKWLVGKVDQEGLDETIAAEEMLINKVKGAQKVTKKQQLLAALGLIGSDATLKLSDFRSHGFQGQGE